MSLSKPTDSMKPSTQNYISVCGICLSAYEVPKVLIPCLHSFCLGCIREWASQVISSDARESRVVSCPNCRKDSVLPTNGVDGLPTNFYITERNQVENAPVCNSCENPDREIVARCRECGFVCSECAPPHKTMRSLKSHSVIMLHSLRVGKTEKQMAMLGMSGGKGQRVPGSGCFELEKTIDLKAVDSSYSAYCCTITSATEFEVAVPFHSTASGKVYVFGMDGKTKLVIDTKKGILPGRSSTPWDVATTADGHVCITDCNPWVTIHDKSGRFASQLQLSGKNGVKCTSGNARGIMIDNSGQIIVSEIVSKTISIYKGDKTFMNAFSVDMCPYYVTTKYGDIDVLLITDIDSENIIEVDYSGKVIKTIAPPLADVKWNPNGICCSKAGEIFVVNGVGGGKGCVCRYTNTWEYTGCVISDLVGPRGVSISEDGEVLAVVDKYAKLKIFRRV